MNLTIQKAKKINTKEIVSIHKKCVTISNSKYYSKNSIKEWLDTINSKNVLDQLNSTQWYLLKLGEEIIGFGQIDITKGILYQIQIDPDFQNEGYGKHLLQHLIKEFREHGIKQIGLFSTLNAVSFYETN